MRLLDLGNRVELVNRARTGVVVFGYEGEPYLRVGPSGVFENPRSPSVALAGFLLAAFSGVGDITTLTRSEVPYSFSASAARAAVAVTLGAGFGLALAALVVLRRRPEIRAAD